MNLNQLFTEQNKLDQHIYKKHNINPDDIFTEKVWAFITELAECGNEFELYKYWKTNKKMDREKGLIEFVDIVHFSISLLLQCGGEKHDYNKTVPKDINQQFINVTSCAVTLSMTKSKEHAIALLNSVIALGYALGFTETEVLTQYQKKNNINYDRQEANSY